MSIDRLFSWQKNISLTAAAVVIIALLGWVSFSMIEKQINSAVAETLTTTLEITDQAIISWVEENKHSVNALAKSKQIVALTQQLLATPRTAQALIDAPAQGEIRSLLAPYLAAHKYRGFFVIAPDNISLASTRNANMGTQNLLARQPEFLRQLWAGKTVITLPQESDVSLKNDAGVLERGLPTMFSGAAVSNEEGEIIAVLTLRIDVFNDFAKIFQRGRIGETGESYAFDREAVMLSASRFDAQLVSGGYLPKGQRSVLNVTLRVPQKAARSPDGPQTQLPLTKMAESALKGHRGVATQGYYDYRGVRVVGAWLWSKQLGMGLATEQNYDEAFRPLVTARRFFILFCVLTAMSVGVMALLFERHRRRVEKERERYKVLFEGASDSIFLIDPNTLGYVDVNENAASRLGYTREELLRIGPRGINSQEMFKNIGLIVADLRKKGGLLYEWRHRHRDGTMTPVEISSRLIEIDGRQVIQSITRDISKHKELECALRSAKSEAEMANRSKTEFLANMSHELRTPLNAIIGFSEIIKEAMLGPVSCPQYQDYACSIHLSGRYLLAVISDILDISKIEIGTLNISREDVDIEELFESCKRILDFRVTEVQAVLNFTRDENTQTLYGDPLRIKQVLLNIIVNAIKFSHKGGTVAVHASTDSDKNSTLVVTDEGVGIAEGNLEKIFEKFEQVRDGHTHTHEGTGLGLAIAKNLIELHGGTLSVQSSLGKGTTVSILLPQRLREPVVSEPAQGQLKRAAFS